MKTPLTAKTKILLLTALSFLIILLGIALGSVRIPPAEIFPILRHKILGGELPGQIKATTAAILWDVRLPRALLAFVAGAALSVSGTVMQSVMRNPLASSYTLGVSSGASLGAGLIILYGAALPVAANAALPVTGFLFGLLTIFLILGLSRRLDGLLQNNTIILVGMVFSLFINAITTLMSFFAREQLTRLVYWQMGSFSLKDWPAVFILAPVTMAGTLFITHYNRELDMMTFGEDQAVSMGVNIKAAKRILLVAAAALTGAAISFCGIIGFVDLIAPHIVRKLFGASHRYVVPMTAVFGGAFMVLCDLAARMAAPPGELPVGAVTAIIGAPFFAYIYFGRRKKHVTA